MTFSSMRLARCAGSIILAAILLAFTLGFVDGAGHLTRVTTASTPGNGQYQDSRQSRFPIISADGTKIAFYSNSDFWGQSIITSESRIWLYNTATMTFTSNITGGIGRDSLSGNGQKMAFKRDGEIWLYDTQTLSVTRITTASASNRGSSTPSINADGTKIAFASDSDFLGQSIPNDQFEIWLYDTDTMTVTRITTASHSDRDSGYYLSFSGDGTKIAFTSDSDFLGQNIPAFQDEIWLYDTTTMTVTRITSDSNRHSFSPSLGYSGTKIAFISETDFSGPGGEIWFYDMDTMTYTRVTTPPNEEGSYHPSMSADETKLAFMSDSDMLGHGDVDSTEIWLYDIETQKLTRITISEGAGGIRDSEAPSINANGSVIAFSSDADFLNQGIPAEQYEVWLYRPAVYLPVVIK